MLSQIGTAVGDALLMAWEVWWALVLGFAISAIVQAWVPRERVQSAMAGRGARPVAVATGLGAASSSCSYAAVAIAKSLFQKGASAASAFAFQIASTNLVWELGLVLWVLIGWQFTVAEYVGGIVMIILLALLLRVLMPGPLEREGRHNAQRADAGHQHAAAGGEMALRGRLLSVDAWSDVAHNFRGDWQMLWKEICTGFLLAGFVGLLGNDIFSNLFLTDRSGVLAAVWNVIAGILIAVASFVCSVGNVPLAAVLWSGGISFGGVLGFLFADLIVLPIVVIYRKYYGKRFAVRLTGLLFLTMAAAALIVELVFDRLGLIPSTRPDRSQVFGTVGLDYKLVLNVLALIVFAALFGLTMRRGATDPVCGMTVDRSRALRLEDGEGTHYFCSAGCRDRFLSSQT
ncbi:MAG TPA: permease [Gaiellales bacterium]|nr:permease [Gaiellales bacterium]